MPCFGLVSFDELEDSVWRICGVAAVSFGTDVPAIEDPALWASGAASATAVIAVPLPALRFGDDDDDATGIALPLLDFATL